MPLEAAMICLDNSEWMRNGDYAPDRMGAQNETVNHIINVKINSNQESTVGVLSMSGERIDVHMSPCRQVGQLMTAIRKVKVQGTCNFAAGLKTAQLALKNRQNKNQRQRVVMFVGSPVTDDVKDLVKLGKGFKKNKVAVDVINFGNENADNDNAEKLEAFVNAVNSSDNSHLLNVPPGPHVLSDLVLTSAIMSEGGAAAPGGAGAAGGMGGMGGMEDDPELAMALRMSMEEERQRQERAAAASSGGADGAAAAAPATPAPAGGDGMDADTLAAIAASQADMEDDYEDDEDALLAQAIALSMAANGGDVDVSEVQTPAKKPEEKEAASAAPAAEPEQQQEADIADLLNDADFLSDLLESVPGAEGADLDDVLSSLVDDEGEKDKKKD